MKTGFPTPDPHPRERKWPGKTTHPLLECRRLAKSYAVKGDRIAVLKEISFTMAGGEIAVIRGKSGAGKSTLLEILGGLARPDSGEIWFENRRIKNASRKELTFLRRRKIGIVFQNFNLIPSWTAFENVEAALLHTGLSKSNRHKKVHGLLRNLGLDGKIHYLPSELSIGQQQRVAIARALANEPELILADEPTGEVDAETAQEIIDHLIWTVKRKGTSLIVATHGTFPLGIADRVLHLNGGTIEEE